MNFNRKFICRLVVLLAAMESCLQRGNASSKLISNAILDEDGVKASKEEGKGDKYQIDKAVEEVNDPHQLYKNNIAGSMSNGHKIPRAQTLDNNKDTGYKETGLGNAVIKRIPSGSQPERMLRSKRRSRRHKKSHQKKNTRRRKKRRKLYDEPDMGALMEEFPDFEPPDIPVGGVPRKPPTPQICYVKSIFYPQYNSPNIKLNLGENPEAYDKWMDSKGDDGVTNKNRKPKTPGIEDIFQLASPQLQPSFLRILSEKPSKDGNANFKGYVLI